VSITIGFSAVYLYADQTPATAEPLTLNDIPERLVPEKTADEADRDRKEALVLFASGRAMELADDLPAALKNYQRALRLDPQSAEIVREIVPLAVRLDRDGAAVRYALLADEMNVPLDPLLLRQLGVSRAQKEDWASALRLFECAADMRSSIEDADDVLLRLELGRLYHLLEKFDEAADCFAQVVKALDEPQKYGLDEKIQKAILDEPADTYQTFGDAFVRTGRLEEAKDAYEKANGYSPNKALLQYEYARIAVEREKYDDALAALESAFAEKLSGQGTGPYELLAFVLEKLKKQNDLIPRLEKLRDADEDDRSLGYFLALKYADSGSLDKAASLYSALLQTSPTFSGYRGLVDVYIRAKNYEGLLTILGETQDKAGMLETLGKETAKISEDAELLKKLTETAKARFKAAPEKIDRGQNLAMGILAADAKQWATAEEFFTRAAKADPNQNGEVYLMWGLSLLLAERPGESARVFQKAIDGLQIAEEGANFYFYLAGALALENRTNDALAAAEKAARLKPGSIIFLARPAWVLTRGKRYEDAFKAYRDLLKKYENDFSSEDFRDGLKDVRLAFSNVCSLSGRPNDAEEQLQLVLDEFPEDPAALNDLGYFWIERGEHLDRAERLIQKAVGIDPDNSAYLDSLGWLQFRRGKFDEAAAVLQKAAESSPDATIFEHLGDAYRELGQTEKASAHWRKAAEMYRKNKEDDKAKAVEKKINK
jgi:tetratricopeptide (TPR) repeat protein